jgi:hypothetical protein
LPETHVQEDDFDASAPESTVTRLWPCAAKTLPRPCGIDQVFRRRGQQAIRDGLVGCGPGSTIAVADHLLGAAISPQPFFGLVAALGQVHTKSTGVV